MGDNLEEFVIPVETIPVETTGKSNPFENATVQQGSLAALAKIADGLGYRVVPKNDSPKRVTRAALLRRGHNKIRLIADLAADEENNNELARKYHVTSDVIADFAIEFSYEIGKMQQEIEAGLRDDYRLLWVGNKANRLAAYQEQIRQIDEHIALAEAINRPLNPQLVKLQQQALRYVAEELGELPPRIQIASPNTQVNYTVEGIDPNVLK